MTVQHPLLEPGVNALATPLPRVLRPQRAVPSDALRPTRAEINLANLRHNHDPSWMAALLRELRGC